MSGMQDLSAVCCATRKNAAPLPKHENQHTPDERGANHRPLPGTRNASVLTR